jgi:rfaE bifunctional protein nucleotidyltransferase chain/domain
LKILTLLETDAWVARERAAGRRIGFTCGSFDVLHAGHVQYLSEARRRCDRLLVAVNSDESIRRYKSPLRPINPEAERIYVVAGLESVDAVTRLDDDRPLPLIERWKPDLYIKGGDYAVDSLRSGEAVRAYGGTVEVIRPEFETSSTRMFERIALLEAHATLLDAPTRPWRALALLDRDGTLIRNIPFLHDPAQVELLPGVAEGLKRLQDAGVALAIVSNQQGIGLGYFTVQDFIEVNQALFRKLGPHGIKIARVYFCPHSLAGDCPCRKPAPAMIERALRDFGVPADRTFVIGDMAADVQAGAAAGCRTFQVGESDKAGDADFTRAVEWVLAQLASVGMV